MIYIILAHNSPEMLSLLVKQLQDKANHFVIHIDQNKDITPYLNAVAGIRNCHFTPKRYPSYWGSFALVEATLHAFDFIRKKLRKRQRIVLLSGADLPIKSNRYIDYFLNSHLDTIFITYHPIPRKIWHKGGITRFPLYETISKSLKFYGGSQWFSIPYKALSIIFEFLRVNPDFLEYFRYVKIPDESFFQTLFLNCEHPYIENNLRNQNLHLIKWDKPYMHPRLLNENNLYQIKKSKSLFARKFDIVQSSKIINYLTNSDIPNSEKQHKKTAILYLTVDLKRYKGRYKKIKNQVKNADVYSVITDKKQYRKEADSILYEHHKCIEMGYASYKENSILPGSTYFALLYFFKQNQKYDYYWLIEDDVVYNGHWNDFFNKFVNNNTDFIGCYNTLQKDAEHWFWWPDISILNNEINNMTKIRTFYPTARFSAKALEFLDQSLKSSVSGHGEVLVPTILNNFGFSISDIADVLSIGNSIDAIILPCSNKAIGSNNNGTYRYRPYITKEEIQGEYLYHPVKFSTE